MSSGNVSLPVTVSAPPPTAGGSVQNTTAVALSAASAGDLVIWAFECIKQHSLIVPDQPTAMIMGAGLIPIIHALGRWIQNKLTPVVSTPVATLSTPIPQPTEQGNQP